MIKELLKPVHLVSHKWKMQHIHYNCYAETHTSLAVYTTHVVILLVGHTQKAKACLRCLPKAKILR